MGNYTVCPWVNALSDHDAQLIMLNDIDLQPQYYLIQTTQKINKYIADDFLIK